MSEYLVQCHDIASFLFPLRVARPTEEVAARALLRTLLGYACTGSPHRFLALIVFTPKSLACVACPLRRLYSLRGGLRAHLSDRDDDGCAVGRCRRAGAERGSAGRGGGGGGEGKCRLHKHTTLASGFECNTKRIREIKNNSSPLHINLFHALGMQWGVREVRYGLRECAARRAVCFRAQRAAS